MVSLRSALRDIRVLARKDLDSATFRHESARRIAAAVPVDGYCFAEADPDSLALTTHATHNVDRSMAPVLYLNEYGQRDFLKHSALVRGPAPAGSLLTATGGEIGRSRRYRELLHPLDLGHELRVAAIVDGRAWGFVHLFRRHGRPPFTEAETLGLAQSSPILAAGIRDALLATATSAPALTPARLAPVMVVLDATNHLVETTPGAMEVVAQLVDPGEAPELAPEVLITLAIWARAQSTRPEHERETVSMRMRGLDGAWRALHAAPTTSAGDRHDRVAVIIQPAAPPAGPDALRARFGLSAGEAEVVEKVLGGRSTAQIAAELFVSAWTVQDRLKNIFTKTGVRSRRELIVLLRPSA